MSVRVVRVRTNACCTSAAVSAQPTIVPEALIDRASLSLPPSVPRSFMVPAFQRNARWWPAESFAQPTIWPVPFTALAALASPPRVPRSTIPAPDVQRKAWLKSSGLVCDRPTTVSASLSPSATARPAPPSSVPRSRYVPLRRRIACSSLPPSSKLFAYPAVSPAELIAMKPVFEELGSEVCPGLTSLGVVPSRHVHGQWKSGKASPATQPLALMLQPVMSSSQLSPQPGSIGPIWYAAQVCCAPVAAAARADVPARAQAAQARVATMTRSMGGLLCGSGLLAADVTESPTRRVDGGHTPSVTGVTWPVRRYAARRLARYSDRSAA